MTERMRGSADASGRSCDQEVSRSAAPIVRRTSPAAPDPGGGVEVPAAAANASQMFGDAIGSGVPSRDPRAGADAAIAAAPAGGGSAMPAHLEQRFGSAGFDVSGVRMHTGSGSAVAAEAAGARAFARGQDVHFGAGAYAPGTSDGDLLIAHEVAHTVQQRGGAESVQAKLADGTGGDAAENEADMFANAVLAGLPVTAPTQRSAGIARWANASTAQPVLRAIAAATPPQLVAIERALGDAEGSGDRMVPLDIPGFAGYVSRDDVEGLLRDARTHMRSVAPHAPPTVPGPTAPPLVPPCAPADATVRTSFAEARRAVVAPTTAAAADSVARILIAARDAHRDPTEAMLCFELDGRGFHVPTSELDQLIDLAFAHRTELETRAASVAAPTAGTDPSSGPPESTSSTEPDDGRLPGYLPHAGSAGSALIAARDANLRIENYVEPSRRLAARALADYEAGIIPHMDARRMAADGRTAALHDTRARLSPGARSTSEAIREGGHTVEELGRHYTLQLLGEQPTLRARYRIPTLEAGAPNYNAAAVEAAILDLRDTEEISVRVIAAAGRPNGAMTRMARTVRVIGPVVAATGLAISAYEVYDAPRGQHAWTAGRETASFAAGTLGSVGGGLVAGWTASAFCGPAAPVCAIAVTLTIVGAATTGSSMLGAAGYEAAVPRSAFDGLPDAEDVIAGAPSAVGTVSRAASGGYGGLMDRDREATRDRRRRGEATSGGEMPPSSGGEAPLPIPRDPSPGPTCDPEHPERG